MFTSVRLASGTRRGLNRPVYANCCRDAPVWVGDRELPPEAQGFVVLGTPLGSDQYKREALRERLRSHARLFDKPPGLSDLQYAWFLLLMCAVPRSNYLLRSLPSSLTEEFAGEHDAGAAQCLRELLALSPRRPGRQAGQATLQVGRSGPPLSHRWAGSSLLGFLGGYAAHAPCATPARGGRDPEPGGMFVAKGDGRLPWMRQVRGLLRAP